MSNLPVEDCSKSDELGCYEEELKVGQRREAELDELWQVVKAWVDHVGAIRSTSATSFRIFANTRVSKLKEGNA